MSLENQVKNLEIESKTLNSEDFKLKLEAFEKTFKNSKFSNFRPLSIELQNLKSNVRSNDVNFGNSLRGTII